MRVGGTVGAAEFACDAVLLPCPPLLGCVAALSPCPPQVGLGRKAGAVAVVPGQGTGALLLATCPPTFAVG